MTFKDSIPRQEIKMMKFAAVIFAGLLAMVIANAVEAAPELKTETKKPDTKSPSKKANKKDESSLAKEIKDLILEDSVVGTGKTATKGKTITVNYTGWFYDPSQPEGRGRQFDTSVGTEPFTFKLGGGLVIKGWEEGFENMKVGGKRKLIIPAKMAYGPNGAGNVIPPNQTLMFEVELIDVM